MEEASVTGADREVDQKYGSMRARHGIDHASANGYVGQWFFQRERRFLVPRIKPGLVLDVACGSALMLQDCPGLEVVGLDYNQTACEQAKWNKQIICRGNAFNLPFSESTFDAVVNCQFLNQQPDLQRQKFITEVSRVLKPGGHCHIMWRGADTLIHRTVNFGDSFLRKLKSEPIFPQYHHPPSRLLDDAKLAGLKLIEVNMTLPIGPAAIQPGSLAARLLGASYYVDLQKTSCS